MIEKVVKVTKQLLLLWAPGLTDITANRTNLVGSSVRLKIGFGIWRYSVFFSRL